MRANRVGKIVVLLALAGCDDRLPALTDGAALNRDQGADAPAELDTAPQPWDSGPLPTECVVGIRVDNCCTNAEPVTRAALQADPCLVPYPPSLPLPAECVAQWRPECDVIDCAFGPPPSRLAVFNASTGVCMFTDECQRPDDCALARDAFACCSCFEAYPRPLVEGEPCLITPPQSAIPAECINPRCAAVDCAACPGIPRGVTCSLMDSYSRCAPSTGP